MERLIQIESTGSGIAFVRRVGVRVDGDTEIFGRPGAEINLLASLTAKGTPGIAGFEKTVPTAGRTGNDTVIVVG